MFSPEEQAIVERRVREDVERNAKRKREVEGKKASDEMQRREKEKIEKGLKEATSTKLREPRRLQPGERVEDEVFRIGPDATQPWTSDDEVRPILKNQPHASGTVYGNDFAIRFTKEQMVPKPMLLGDAPRDAAQVRPTSEQLFRFA